MPKPRKPDHLKLVSGTDQPCRAAPPSIEFPRVQSLPAAPDWLPNAHAIKEWDRLAPILFANGLLTEAALSALGVLCALHGEIVDMWARRVTPTASTIAQYRSMVNDFGLTPVAQGKVKPLGDEKKGNRFGNNGKRA